MTKNKHPKTADSAKSFSRALSTHFSELAVSASQALARLVDLNDRDALHDLRINLRSQRVLQGLFPRSNLIREQRTQLGMAARQTGKNRDQEVMLLLAESLCAETGNGGSIVSVLADNLLVSRKNLLSSLQIMQLSETLSQVSTAWAQKISNKRRIVLQTLARAQTRKLEKRFLIAAADLQLNSPIADWHALRLRVKQLRYWEEGFSVMLTRRQCRRLSALVQLQQRLGLLHDLSLFETHFPPELTLPEQWREMLQKRQQHALTDAAGMLQHLKSNWS